MNKRQPVKVTITFDGGEVFAILMEGKEWGNLEKDFGRASFLEDVLLYTRAAVHAADARHEKGAA